MDIRRLVYFCAIVDHGNLSNAAKFLNITQPPLSIALKELEDDLGKTLIYRKGRRISLTPDGQIFYGKAVRLLKSIDEFEFSLHQEGKIQAKKLKIGVASPAEYFIQKFIDDTAPSKPDVSIELFVSSIYQIETALQERKIDFAIVREPLSYSNYTVSKLGRYCHLAVYSTGLKAPDREEITVKDLDGISLILPKAWSDRTTLFNDHVRKLFYSAGLQPKVILETDQHAIILNFLLRGTPLVTFLPEFYRSREELGSLQFRHLSPDLQFEFILIYRSDIFMDDTTMEVIRMIRNFAIR